MRLGTTRAGEQTCVLARLVCIALKIAGLGTHLDQVIVGIAHVDAEDRSDSTGALDGALDNLDAVLLQVFLSRAQASA